MWKFFGALRNLINNVLVGNFDFMGHGFVFAPAALAYTRGTLFHEKLPRRLNSADSHGEKT